MFTALGTWSHQKASKCLLLRLSGEAAAPGSLFLQDQHHEAAAEALAPPLLAR